MKKVFLILLSVGIFAQETETQNYEVIKSMNNFEIRFYPSVVKAKVTSDRNFAKLFRYISGNNEGSEKIAMTSPVYMTTEGNKNTMEFVLPSKYSIQNASQPLDKEIQIYSTKPGYYAAIQFGGYSNSEKVKKNHEVLLQKLAENGYKTIQKLPMSLTYNSPYKVFNRRNEVLIQIEYP